MIQGTQKMKHSTFRTSSAARQYFASDRFHKPCSGGFVGSSVAVRRLGAATRGGFASAVRGQALAQTHSTRLRLGSGRRQFHRHFRTPSLLDAQRSNSFQGVEFNRGHPIATKLESPSVSLSCALLTMPGTFYEYCATPPQA